MKTLRTITISVLRACVPVRVCALLPPRHVHVSGRVCGCGPSILFPPRVYVCVQSDHDHVNSALPHVRGRGRGCGCVHVCVHALVLTFYLHGKPKKTHSNRQVRKTMAGLRRAYS